MKRNIILVTAENTEVGKTFTSCALIKALTDHGHIIGARKPLESYQPGETRDSHLLSLASNDDTVVNPDWSYELPMAPIMAGRALSRYVPSTKEVVRYLDDCEKDKCLTLLEGVGGPYSPLTSDGNTLSLIKLLKPKIVLLVIKSGLGAINSTLLCLSPLVNEKVIVYFNRYDPTDLVHKTNIEFLEKLLKDGTSLGIPGNKTFPDVTLTTDLDILRDLCEKEFSGCHFYNTNETK